ncbi:alanine dehydrogenase [Xylanimonas cellulosilytica DSM 15894]|uniref:Alanine dehydrogenase n=1 Tax=Xylanimonas cellulosilytica (strain DSM 15894 / JCM 12276 / CECT 5975 / KCTC 9989 / LMG 20990 / NBRC 107835 / XIL07) TaxID=446471 RepID=D1BSU9_XYLCX|nr:alanine dehydrogenase [Xylanimonas cellulosilytica]ACZ30791.1 alanine dehydrogenase [Xylanimonas cellulosilytica DSM 15894]
MRIAVPKEVKNHEYRVAVTPAGVHELVRHGHSVHVQAGAGEGSSITDDEYAAAGAVIEPDAATTWGAGELVLKVKEPVPAEYLHLRDGQVLFTYLHLAADRALTLELCARGVTGIAYETVQTDTGALPLLAPMSEVAGRLAPQVGAACLLKAAGGRGLLLGGVPGVAPGHVVIIGAGVSGMNAARVAVGMGARVTVVDRSARALAAADAHFDGRVQTLASNAWEIERAVLDADVVVGAVLVAGAKAPVLVSTDLVARMRPGSVLVDISIDQGGCFEDSRPTTHADPTYRVHGTTFYAVANMPGAVPNTSTRALTNVTLPYVVELANLGWQAAVRADATLARGLNTHAGAVTHAGVAEAHGLELTPLDVQH